MKQTVGKIIRRPGIQGGWENVTRVIGFPQPEREKNSRRKNLEPGWEGGKGSR